MILLCRYASGLSIKWGWGLLPLGKIFDFFFVFWQNNLAFFTNILKLGWAILPKYFILFFLEVLVVKKLFVGSLPWAYTDDSLKTAFEPFGKVVSAKVIRDRESGRSRGFGFVEMENEADAEKAITALNESEVSGRKITVKEALSK